MTTINLRNYYYYYKQGKFVEVSDEVAEALLIQARKQHKRFTRDFLKDNLYIPYN